MTLLFEDTQLLLALDLRADDSSLDAALESLSGTVVTQLALEAKAKSYRARVDRGLAAAANQGATLDELAAAAGMSPDEVLARLRTTLRGLVEPATRGRLGLDARPSAHVGARPSRDPQRVAVSSSQAPSGVARAPRKGWAWLSRREV